jgi:putative heme-binding domain-containing protein
MSSFQRFITFTNAWIAIWLGCVANLACTARAQPPAQLFARDNLVAWCIVPFDAKRRGPEERAQMLENLGIHKLAYDYRAEHIPTFDAEMEALKRHNIELTAWWFPTELNDEAKLILDVLKRHDIKTQLWVTGSGTPTSNAEEQEARVAAEANRIRPIAEAAARIDCRVGLYNHGGWFGEPENQIAIIEKLGLKNVGIVYNLHHGHEHIDRFPELLEKMKPYLYVINLNGMVRDGDRLGQKILPLGAGDLDLNLLTSIRDSSYSGPIGILNHTDEDAEGRLLDNLDGLQWLNHQLDGSPAGPRPRYRTWRPMPEPALQGGRLLEGRAEFREPPLTLECRVQLDRHDVYNILAACDTKQSPSHWELFTEAGNGHLTVYLPGHRPDHVRSGVMVCDAKTHDVAMIYEADRVRLYVDGKRVADQAIESSGGQPVPGGFAIGRLVEGGFQCFGTIGWMRLSHGARSIPKTPPSHVERDEATIEVWEFQELNAPDAEEPVGQGAQSGAMPAPLEYRPELIAEFVEGARQHGDARRGMVWFSAVTSACISCHKIGPHGGSVGPELTQIGTQRKPEEIVESVLWPGRQVAKEYIQWTVTTVDGNAAQGYRTAVTDDHIVLRDPSTGTEHTIASGDIEEQIEMGTLMPDGAMAALPREQQWDMLRFLMSLGHTPDISKELGATLATQAHGHAAEVVEFDRAPLRASDWPNATHPVNRDRLYDWYTKQAEYFRRQRHVPLLLGDFPGLDGGQQSHWGNQDEDFWRDGRWNDTTLGSVQAGVFRGEDVTVPRGVCVKLGDNDGLSVCFNPDTLTYDAVWTGGFVRFSDIRHGFMHGLQLDGQWVQGRNRPPVQGQHKYHGFYRHGDRVVFAYSIGDQEYLDSPSVENGKFVSTVALRDQHPLRDSIHGGPAQWPRSLATPIVLGNESPYAIDTITLPFDNPWKALLFCGGHDFLSDGTALVCTMQGDVWHVSGLTEEPQQDGKAVWRRFASGLHHPQGLVVANDEVFVQGRDQITRLRDLNGDGEADFYECFSSAPTTSAAGHDFICGLQRDQSGYFYTASGNQGLVRVTPDGQRAEVLATGFRNPDGLGLMPDGTLTVPCSEGEWTPASMICAIPPAAADQARAPWFFGYGGPRGGGAPELPLVYLPRGLDNSSAEQVMVTSDRWGPLQGQMLHLSFGMGRHFLLLTDRVDGQLQGGVVPLVGDFRSGAHRGRFNPQDGQLYVTGMAGWGSYTPDDGCFQRVRYTGQEVQQPIGFHVHANGVQLKFSAPLDRETAELPTNHFAQCWNYRYSAAYGSPEFSTKALGVRGHDVLTISRAHLLEDNQTLFLEIPDIQPVNQLHLHVQVAPGEFRELFLTVHRYDTPFTEIPDYRPVVKTMAPHPQKMDLMLATRRLPNPWRNPLPQAREITIEAGKNLSYVTRELQASAGEPLALTFDNPDVVPHNWVLLRPGSLVTVGQMANRLVSDPEAAVRHYVPESDDVLVYTDIVAPKEKFTVHFRAPDTPGRYPYLCTFPGHWMVMNGTMIVE